MDTALRAADQADDPRLDHPAGAVMFQRPKHGPHQGVPGVAPVDRSGSIARMLSPDDETRAVAELAQRLTVSFPNVPPAVVQATVSTTHQRFAGSPIRDFVPVLVERMAKTSLATTTTTVRNDESQAAHGRLIPRQPTGETKPKRARP